VRFARTRLATGPTIHFAEQGDVHGEPVVFLHGWPDSWFSFSRVLTLLPPRVHAFALDQRGFGESDRPEAGYRVSDFAADAAAFLDAVSIERASFVGHSFGSFVARQVAVTSADRVSRLVLIGTAMSASNPVTREVQRSMGHLPDPVPVEFARAFQAGTAYRPLPDAFFDRIVSESLKLPSRLWRDVFDRLLEHDDRADLPRIAAPTLLLWGDRDALFARVDQDDLLSALPDVTLRVYAETGHCPNWERPESVAADLQAFVAPA
jgi:pimeloyl-ACP methyl ester carboxylesterase